MILAIFNWQFILRNKVKIDLFLHLVSMCSKKYRKMIKDLYFVFGLSPNLIKSS